MSGRFFFRRFLFLSLTFVGGLALVLAWAWSGRGSSPSVLRSEEKSPALAPLGEESRGDSPSVDFAKLFQNPAPPQSATVEEVRAARNFQNPREKSRYLQLLEALGFRGAEALPWLRAALNDPDQEIRRAAMRGLGRTETAEAEVFLVSYAKDGVAIEESTEAALVLGQMAQPAITAKLQELLRQSQNPVLREHLVDALAGRPWEQSSEFFLQHLKNPGVAMEEKQNALGMLGMRDTAPAGILTAALSDSAEEMRAGAYQGLAWRGGTSESMRIRNALRREKDPGLRALAYEAWGNQLDADRMEILSAYRSEREEAVKVRALKAWAQAYARNRGTDPFLPQAIRSLEQVAMNDRDPGERRQALLALKTLGGEESRAALLRISETNSLRRVRDLARSMALSGH